MNCKFDLVEMSNSYFHHGFLFHKKKVMKAAIRYRIAGFYFAPGRASMRRYSRVRMARNRGPTAGSQGISRERQRSMAARKSRRNATQDGHASICSRICSQVSGSTLPSRYSERLANRSRHSAGRCVSVAFATFCFLAVAFAPFGYSERPRRSWSISLRTLRRAR